MPKKKKCKKAKWLRRLYKIAEERKEVQAGRKGKIHPTELIVPENTKER